MKRKSLPLFLAIGFHLPLPLNKNGKASAIVPQVGIIKIEK